VCPKRKLITNGKNTMSGKKEGTGKKKRRGGKRGEKSAIKGGKNRSRLAIRP